MRLRFRGHLGENFWLGRDHPLASYDAFGADIGHAADRVFRIALLIPMSGAAGIWGPSCLSCGQLAVREINAGGGIKGCPVEVNVIDCAHEAGPLPQVELAWLLDHGLVDAVIGMHISAVRQQIIDVIRGRAPFVYTPIYEGGETAPSVYALGETPQRLLGPAIDYLTRQYRIKRWALIGNDYVWPRRSHDYVRKKLAQDGLDLVQERYVTFQSGTLSDEIERLAASRAEAVLVSLVGQDAVDFNRHFGARNLHRSMIRLSGAIEENGLLASGLRNTERLFVASSYFSTLDTERNLAFCERYRAFHADRAPIPNALGQSIYEGFHFLAGLLASAGEQPIAAPLVLRAPLHYTSVRKARFLSNASTASEIYLARANGGAFEDFIRMSG
ncbi:MAG: substrate-binding domain-containing protein [Pseudomonadota bacterium]